ncbi:MAG TPA: type II CAAX endopeptidase family protein [Bryobacteraceae bacterium]|nr:type II CAAX endopeptidase family protein [Bryobacteraceae bacterium]
MTPRDEDEAFWSYRDALLFAGLSIPCLLGGALIAKFVLVALWTGTTHKALELLPGQFIGYGLLFGALALLLQTEYGRPFWRSLGFRAPRLSYPSITALGMTLAFLVGMLGAVLKTPEVPSPMKELLDDRVSLIAVAFFGVTLGPLCEEIAFRGFLQPLFMRSLGAPGGILLSGAAFGLLHLPQYGYTWQHGILITLAGSAFGWMRWYSGSTLGSTVMHCAYNLTLFVGFFAAGSRAPHSW